MLGVNYSHAVQKPGLHGVGVLNSPKEDFAVVYVLGGFVIKI